MSAEDERKIRTADAVAFAQRVVALRFADCEGAILAGSRARGNASASSDYDIVLIFASLPAGAWREMVDVEGQAVELFAHDPASVSYFCREIDRPSGSPVLPRMISGGIIVKGAESELIIGVRQIASEMLAAGPPPLDSQELEQRRFAITDLAEGIAQCRTQEVRLAAGAALYQALADFALRTADQWSATGKAVPQALAECNPDLSNRFFVAFTDLFGRGEPAPVQSLVDDVLHPYGGRLRTGFRLTAPTSWRDTTPKQDK